MHILERMVKGNVLIQELKTFFRTGFFSLVIPYLIRRFPMGSSANEILKNALSFFLGLYLESLCNFLGYSLIFINNYGPYGGRQTFWSRVFRLECLKVNNLVVRANMNLKLSIHEGCVRVGSHIQGQIIWVTFSTPSFTR